jgi:hypothetical protein
VLLLGHGVTILEESRNIKTVHCNCGILPISSMRAFDGQLWTLTDTFNMALHMVGTSHDKEGLEDEKKL